MNVREEILKSLNPDWTSSNDLADEFCGRDHSRLAQIIHYLRALGWSIETVTDGTQSGRGYKIGQAHYELLRMAYQHSRNRPRGFSMTPPLRGLAK